MASSKEKPSLFTYVTRLLLLEAVKCNQDDNQEGLAWIQRVAKILSSKWRKP